MGASFSSRYVKAAVYGANDGIVTTFAVVAGVAGAGLSPTVIVILGIANMCADAVSMALGDYLGERSEARYRARLRQQYRHSGLWKTGLVTLASFVVAGSMPLAPFILQSIGYRVWTMSDFSLSVVMTAISLFLVGSLRTLVTKGSWITNGLEMLCLGAIAAGLAFGLGHVVGSLVR